VRADGKPPALQRAVRIDELSVDVTRPAAEAVVVHDPDDEKLVVLEVVGDDRVFLVALGTENAESRFAGQRRGTAGCRGNGSQGGHHQQTGYMKPLHRHEILLSVISSGEPPLPGIPGRTSRRQPVAAFGRRRVSIPP